jgi:hypothetical protein
MVHLNWGGNLPGAAMNLSPIRFLACLGLLALAACNSGGGSPPPPPPAPTVSGISPTHGSPGTAVVISGTNFNGVTAVAFNGQAAFSFTTVSTVEIDAVVPGTATTGTIQINTLSNGSATSASFTVDAAQVPTLASFSPSSLSVGSVATLTGTHFVGATQVKFNGVSATAFTVNSDTQIQATAPAGLTAGTIAVTTPGGTATSSTGYTVPLPPTALTYSTPVAVYTNGVAIAANTPSSSGGAVTSYAVSPALPAGLALNTITGVITGTPTVVASVASYTVTASNAVGSTTASLTITVNGSAVPPTGLTYSTPTATYPQGLAITPNTPSSGGGAVSTYSVSPALPAGLVLNTSTGVITGTPTTPTATLTYMVTATNLGGSTSAPLTITVTASSSAQVLMNGGFEQTTPIIWQGDTGIIGAAPGASNPNLVPHSGTQFAWLDGYTAANTDDIYQNFYIPATATSATATFYLKTLTNQVGSSAVDVLTVSARDTAGNLLLNGTLLTKSNLDASTGYALFSVNLLPFKGQAVRLDFKGVQAGATTTSFLLDDVAVNITVPVSTDLKPLITSFTPTTGFPGIDTVLITGGNFFGVTTVSIGGASATYTLKDGTSLSATVPATAAAGSVPISITNAQGTGTSSTNFTTTISPPTITAVNPTMAPVGANVVITGTYLANVTLALNGVNVTITSQSATQLTFTVPVGAVSGNLVVTSSGGSATHAFTVNSATTTLDLHIDKLQLTQSTQTLTNTVPIVAGKPGLVRAFVLANQANTATPSVQVTLLNNGVAVAGYPKLASFTGTSVPTALDESSLAKSWNLVVPGTDLTTPTGSGYSVTAVVNPGGTLPPESDSTNNTITVALIGTTVPTFKTTIFPVVLSSGTGNISLANKDAWAARLVKMYPVGSWDVAVGASFTDATISTLASDGTGWNTVLQDLALKHQADAVTDRYYYGALNVSYGSGVAGLGYVPNVSSAAFYYRTAIGWDKASGYADGGNYPEVFAHETGHNMGRQHSPCGGPASPDPSYPYAGGLIGVWGYDSTSNVLHSPLVDKDIMAYCSPVWVSDYVYKGILNFRAGSGGFLTVGAEDAPLPKALAVVQDCLLVRGIVHDDGSVELLPSFRTKALPTAPVGAGEYTLAGLDAKGATLFTAPIELAELGCWPKGHERHFLLALPYDATLLDALGGLSVLKGGQVLTSLRTATATMAVTPELLRLSEDQVQVTWDASVHPTVLVRDAVSGEVVAILQGGQQPFTSKVKSFDVVLSDGVSGRTHHLETPN